MKSDIAIKVENLSKCYTLRHPVKDEDGNGTNELWALKDVSFEIKKGESVGIIGPNGSGKSTLLKILAGVTKPTSGKVTIKGRVASILDIGSGFHPELSGRENVFLNGQIHGFTKKEIEAKFDEIVAFSGIEKFIEEPVKNYSNGMYLRLAFSIMIHLDFDVYLLDEVLSVGDEEFQHKCLEKISDLLHSQKTVLIVHHNMYYSDKIINRVINLKKEASKKTYSGDELVFDNGHINYLTIPNNFSKKNKDIALILVLKSSTNVYLATSQIIYIKKEQFKESFKFSFDLKIASGVYFFNLYDISEDSLYLVHSSLIRVLKNESSFKKYGNQVNSVLFFNTTIIET